MQIQQCQIGLFHALNWYAGASSVLLCSHFAAVVPAPIGSPDLAALWRGITSLIPNAFLEEFRSIIAATSLDQTESPA
jgi:hypothetical protein